MERVKKGGTPAGFEATKKDAPAMGDASNQQTNPKQGGYKIILYYLKIFCNVSMSIYVD